MDDKAQVSLEYLIMVTLSIALAAAAVLLATNLFSLKEGIKDTIRAVKEKTFGLLIYHGG